MARPKTHIKVSRRTVAIINHELYKEARKRAIDLGYTGYGEYVERLISADLKNKVSAASSVARPALA